MKIKKIALMLVLSVSVNIAGSQLVFASEFESTTSNITQISELVDLEKVTVFNPDKMTEDEKNAYNASIDKQVELMKNKHGKNFDSENFRKELVKILETQDSLKNIKSTINKSSSNSRVKRSGTWVPDICISNDYVSAAIAVIIDAVLVASGVGSVALLVKKIGVAEAKRIFTKSIKSKLKAWGCATFAASATTIAGFILELASPEDAAAEFLDSKDSFPNDGSFNVVL